MVGKALRSIRPPNSMQNVKIHLYLLIQTYFFPSILQTMIAWNAFSDCRMQYCTLHTKDSLFRSNWIICLFSQKKFQVTNCLKYWSRRNTYATFFKEVIRSLPFQLKAIINSFCKTFEAKGLPHAKPEKSAKLSACCKGCLFKSVFHLAKGRWQPWGLRFII